jgi:hypothetical protein
MAAPIDIGFAASTSVAAQSGNIGGSTIYGGGRAAKWWQSALMLAIVGSSAWANAVAVCSATSDPRPPAPA